MAQSTLGGMEGSSAIFQRTAPQRLPHIEIGNLPYFDEVPAGGLSSFGGSWRVLAKFAGFNACEVLGEIGRNRSQKVISNAFQYRIVITRPLLLFRVSQRPEPRFALRHCPAGPHIAKVEEKLHQVVRTLCTREQIERPGNDARRLQINQ